ncbi:MAG: hypothetical protein Q4B68_04405 [Bacteroidales bacterium]|nr:hypothetical protein [Bacteroidales bacterium]
MKKILFAILALLSICPIAWAQSSEFDVKSTMYYAGGKFGSRTASGSRIEPAKVLSGEHRWVALSLDLYRAGFNFGDTIVVTEHKTPWVNGLWVVKDKMASSRKIDFLVHRQKGRTFRNSPCKIRKKLPGEDIPTMGGEY